MEYIVCDFEFNQDLTASQTEEPTGVRHFFEIIQVGAVKLDSDLNSIKSFSRYIKPSVYKTVSPFITELTGITTEQLKEEEEFPGVFKSFTEFIGDTEAVLCIWGRSDVKELYNNAAYHNLDQKLLPKLYINIQPYTSLHLCLPRKKLLRLSAASEALGIPAVYPYHNALYDACYTAEIFKKVYTPAIKPVVYDPSYKAVRPRQVRRTIDFEALIRQFEKMYGREMTPEEQGIIRLAYQMGKTQQFLKKTGP